MSTLQIDVKEVAAAAIALLDQRQSKLQARQRADKAQADVEAQKQAAEAAATAWAQRAADKATLATMGRHLRELATEIEVLTEQWRKLPTKISELGLNHSRLLSELAALRQKMGV
jgi:chromosome segregation ATPase